MMSRKNENSKLPFNHKLFYLDITSNPALKTKIDNCVKQLGGTVETFLDRKVRYVVTDKPQKDWPADSKQPANLAAAEKQQENKLELMGLTRGKMLAIKAPTTSAKTKDVLETALRLNMKILTHRSILDFCKKYIKVPTVDDVAAAEQANDPDAAAAKVKVRQLKAPFLKFEDKDEKYAPVYKEFDHWPTVCVDSSSSSLTANTNVLTNNNQTPTVPKNFNTSKLLQPPMQKKRQRVFFCEICSKEFTNMIEHVKTEQHQVYMNNEENYKELRSVIDSLPNWVTLNDTSAFDENDEFTEEESEFEDEDSDEFDEDAYSSESKETNLSDEELPAKANSDHVVPASFTTPIKLFNLNNIFNNIPNAIQPHNGDEREN